MATGALVSVIPKLLGVIPKLGKFLKNEYTLAKKVEKEIEDLVKELEQMQAFLEEECNKPTDQLDKRVQLRARDIREMSYRIEDQIDNFLVRVEGKQEQARPSRSIKRIISKGLASLAKIKTRHNIDGEIKDIKAQVKEAKERYDRYCSNNTDKSPLPSVDPRLDAMYKMVKLIGIDESVGDLLKMLSVGDDDMSSKEKLKTVSVFGVGGLGKTTLAKAVYDKLIKEVGFKYCAFVPVGQSPNVVTVLNNIHYELRGHKCEMDKAIHIIIKELRDFLKDKRYLIVIDDIWDNKHWGIIKNALIENNYGSRVVTTTRKFDVAREIGQVYELKPLTDDNSKKLFCTRIFHSASKCQDYQLDDEVPEEILSKCCGVPLAINTMASLLAGKPRKEWSAVCWSIGFSNNIVNKDVENTKRILSFSFYDMPSQLKACLLYLGAYPEDTLIDIDDLICKWIAEGIVQDEQGAGLFVLGERYFFELINRSMIEPSKTWYKVDGCYVHDMMLALIRSLCADYNFLTILDKEQGTLAQNNIVRRVYYQRETMKEQDLKNERNIVHIRSFVAYGCQIDMTAPFSRFKVLRVLSLNNCAIGFGLKFVGDLPHLRYLSLCGSRIGGELPEELRALKFLQTLDLNDTSFTPDIEELPSWIGQLTQLVCLLTQAEAPGDGAIGKLTSLENLVITAPGGESARKKFLKDVGNLTELRKLYIHIDEDDESTPAASLDLACKLSKLIDLNIYIEGETEFFWLEPGELMLSRYLQSLWLEAVKLASLPKCINSSRLSELVTLRLQVRSVDVWGMRTLGALPDLCYLDLVTESKLLVVDGGCGYFRKLLRCDLATRGTVVFLPDRDGAPTMPSVEELKLTMHACAMKSFCLGYGQDMSFIKTVIGLRSFSSLKSVSVSVNTCIMAEEAVEKALRNAVGDHCSVDADFYALREDPTCNMDILDNVIRFCVPVAWFKRLGFNFDYSYSYFGTLRPLEKVISDISCKFATSSEVKEAMAGLKRSVDAHPDRPMLEMVLHYEDQQPLDHYVATHDNENDGPATASIVAEKEAGKRQHIQIYTPPRVKASTYATSHNTELEPQGFNFTQPAKEFSDCIDLNFGAPMKDVNDWVDLNLENGIDLRFQPPIEDTEDGDDFNIECWNDLNLEPPVLNVTELKLAELSADLVLHDPYANEEGGALSYTSPVDVQAAGAGFGGNTGVDPNDE